MRIIRARDPDDKLLTIELWVERQLQKEKWKYGNDPKK
jgi:hypothetical protein